MNILSVLLLLGGLAFFLYGMKVMSSGLEKMVGGRLEGILEKMTSNPFKSLALGAAITIAIQSSSAMTVMLVGLVNSGIMQLGQTIGIIMGSNIGTTLTAWILSLAGIESESIFIQLLKPENFSPIIAIVGVLLMMVSKRPMRRDAGTVMIGFALLMYSMEMMSSAVSPLADDPNFAGILTAFNNPLLGVLVGAVFTGVIQSSAASVGILQALALTGGITYGMAIPIIMGQNIGTCVTALLSSIGVNRSAKRVAVIHMSFNIIGTAVCLVIYMLCRSIFDVALLDNTIGAVGIALCHSVFNIFSTALLLPFSRQLEKLARIVIPEKRGTDASVFLDERLLTSPSLAVSQCGAMTDRMAELAKSTLFLSLEIIRGYNDRDADIITKNEDELDMYEDKIGSYLVKVSSKDLTDSDSRQVSKILHVIGDLERIGDHAVNLLEVAREISAKKLHFSQEASEELDVLTNALKEILDISITAYKTDDPVMAARVEPLEEVIDGLIDTVKLRHIERLQSGKCTIQLGFVHSDLLTNYERVSDHCSNIGVCVIEIEKGGFDAHEYLNSVVSGQEENFTRAFKEFSDKYTIA